MSIESKVHQAQVDILHVLLFKPDAAFAELQKASGLSSDHFTFHIKQLLEQDLIAKNPKGHYHLTRKGKEFANRFDTDARTVERQPKVAVCLVIARDDGKEIVQQRLKQPYYGYWGRPTGKIRWGETIIAGAARELLEETGLTADLVFDSIYHKMDYNQKTGELLEDKIFFVVNGTHPRGELIEAFEGGRNTWMTREEYAAQSLSFYTNDTFDNTAELPSITIYEARHDYAPEHY
ncbi:MAG TPA: NUDIX domain-containing protein [Magnetospirillaceae bacterium]|nr:NUDIX domain-containing protein [Magnetospirillaceae bacterium]